MVTFNPPDDDLDPELLDLSLLYDNDDDCCDFDVDECRLVPDMEGMISIPPVVDDSCGDV